MTLIELRVVLAVILIWALSVTTAAGWRTSPRWMSWALFVPAVLFLRVNPFSSPMTGLVFVTLASALAVLIGLSLPFRWALAGHLGTAWGLLIGALILVAPFLLQGAAPRRRSIGIALAALFGPWGQWYLEDGGRWVIAVWAACFTAGLAIQLLSTAGSVPVRLPEFPQVWLGWAGVVCHIGSALVMYLRLARPAIETQAAST